MTTANSPKRDLRIAIIGAGPGGLCMAIQLKRAGFNNFVLLEQSDAVGGTWNRNRYPGCACDLPALLYSFSFEIKPDWSRPYAPQSEILEYMEHCAEKYEILPHCRFNTTVKGATWSEDTACWTVELDTGQTLEADVVVSAIGMFNELVWPDIDGLDTFTGTSFHSAHWDWDHDLKGKTVGIIGSAASAVQIVPEIVEEAGQVHLFQRTANWVMPKMDDPSSEEDLDRLRNDPAATRALRQVIFEQVDAGMTFSNPDALAELEASVLGAIEEVKDPELREKLRPQHPFGCKRPLLSNSYYPAFNRSDLELVTDPIDRVTKNSILTADGTERRVDTLVIATGFRATKYLSAIDVRGRGGQSIEEAWSDGASAYLGVTTAGFPNLFMLYGPNTNNGSIIEMIECQVDHALQLIGRITDEDLGWIDVRKQPMEHYNDDVQEAIQGVDVWQAGCNGYYRTPSGRIVTQWPLSMSEFRKRTSHFDSSAFDSGSLTTPSGDSRRASLLDSVPPASGKNAN